VDGSIEKTRDGFRRCEVVDGFWRGNCEVVDGFRCGYVRNSTYRCRVTWQKRHRVDVLTQIICLLQQYIQNYLISTINSAALPVQIDNGPYFKLFITTINPATALVRPRASSRVRCSRLCPDPLVHVCEHSGSRGS
jgi:hypothetical protein